MVHTHRLVKCPCTIWATREISCGGYIMASIAVFDLSMLFLHLGVAHVSNSRHV